MDVQAYRPELIDSFLLGDVPGKKFTLAEKDFAVQNFDRAFEFIFPEEVRSALADEGKDIFDQIYIDGQSMNEKWEAQYAGERYDYASAQMKCRFMERPVFCQNSCGPARGVIRYAFAFECVQQSGKYSSGSGRCRPPETRSVSQRCGGGSGRSGKAGGEKPAGKGCEE